MRISNKIMDIALTREDTAYHAGKGSKAAWKKYAGEECIMDHAIGTATQIIQAYLSEIWKPFDALETDTWPKDHFRTDYLLKFVGERPDIIYYKIGRWNHKKHWFQVDFKDVCPVAYLDPADILPKEDK